jgi:glycosyltransferase involved in cell wall biosynthesis
VMPSLAEGFGLTAVEAAACGAAVVLSDLPPHRESLGDAALYFDPTDVAALASILNRIVTDDALREEHRARARAAVSHLSWDATATRLQSLISEVTHVA